MGMRVTGRLCCSVGDFSFPAVILFKVFSLMKHKSERKEDPPDRQEGMAGVNVRRREALQRSLSRGSCLALSGQPGALSHPHGAVAMRSGYLTASCCKY